MKNITSNIKKLTAGVLAVGMVVAGIVIVPTRAKAAVADDVVIYDESYSIAEYWDNGKKAPVKEGYVFGGWFTETADETADNKENLTSANGTTTKTCVPLTAADIDKDKNDKVDVDAPTALAKFVPAKVLSVKAQNGVHPSSGFQKLDETTANQIDTDHPVWIRVVSSLDSANYQNWGFDIYLANKTKVEKTGGGDCVTTKKYDGLLQGDASNTTTERSAEDIFGAPSDYVFVWQLSKINHKSNVSKIIYVRPYWHTMDGTKVLGLAKYVHMEDQYKNYISVPVNLLGGEQVAAGSLNLTYNNQTLKLVGFEAGRILPKMNYSKIGTTIQMIGYTDTKANEYHSDETIYANLRFEKPTADTSFKVTGESQFCDWSEAFVNVKKVWDIKYVQETTNE